MTAVRPDEDMAAQVRPYWQWSAIIRGGNKHLAPPQIPGTFPETPDRFWVPCWLNLGQYGYQDPLVGRAR